MPMSLLIAPVDPEPQKIDAGDVESPFTRRHDAARASSRRRVVCRPVPLDSVWVFA